MKIFILYRNCQIPQVIFLNFVLLCFTNRFLTFVRRFCLWKQETWFSNGAGVVTFLLRYQIDCSLRLLSYSSEIIMVFKTRYFSIKVFF